MTESNACAFNKGHSNRAAQSVSQRRMMISFIMRALEAWRFISTIICALKAIQILTVSSNGELSFFDQGGKQWAAPPTKHNRRRQYSLQSSALDTIARVSETRRGRPLNSSRMLGCRKAAFHRDFSVADCARRRRNSSIRTSSSLKVGLH